MRPRRAAGGARVVSLPRPSPVPNTTDALPRLGLSTPKNINLQYFDIMGPTERIRYALLLGKVPFNDERVKFSDWPSVKPTTPYGQMPVLTVDGQRFTQSGAILNWAGTITGHRAVIFILSRELGVSQPPN